MFLPFNFNTPPLISSNIHTGTSRHKGCDCNSGFEGDYCEYIYGEGPVWKTNTGAAISWVISIVVFGIVAVSIKIYHAKQSRENDQRKIQFTAAPADLNDDDVIESDQRTHAVRDFDIPILVPEVR